MRPLIAGLGTHSTQVDSEIGRNLCAAWPRLFSVFHRTRDAVDGARDALRDALRDGFCSRKVLPGVGLGRKGRIISLYFFRKIKRERGRKKVKQ